MVEHTPTPWSYRPNKHDDWGWIRGTSSNGEIAPLVACARSGEWESAQMMDDHRTARTDPYGANAAFIVKAVNNHEALVNALNEIAWMDEHLSTETAREMMNIARSALEHMKAPVGGSRE